MLKKYYPPSGRTWANILLFVWLYVSFIKTSTRRIMCPDTRYFVVRLFTCSSLYPARRILNQTNHKYLPGQVGKFVRIMGLNYKNSLCKSTDVAKLTKGMSRIYPTILIFWNCFILWYSDFCMFVFLFVTLFLSFFRLSRQTRTGLRANTKAIMLT